VTTYLIPYRIGGKTRLGDPKLALAMLSDVTEAVNELAEEALVVDGHLGGEPRACDDSQRRSSMRHER
jgi:hypothetical protein